MKSVNKVILIGDLGKDPEVKNTPQGTPVAKITLATNERFIGRPRGGGGAGAGRPALAQIRLPGRMFLLVAHWKGNAFS